MTDRGLIARKELPPPAARSVYTVTRRGRDSVPVLRALARYGMPLLEQADEDVVIAPSMVADAALRAYYDEMRADGIDERYLVHIDSEVFALSSVRGGGEERAEPDLVLRATAATWMDIRQGRTTIRRAIKDRRMTKAGLASALANFADIFQLG